LGFTFCLMIFLFIKDELSYDHFHQNKEQIYRVAAAYLRQGVWEPYSTNSWKTGEVLKTQYPEIEELVRINDTEAIVEFGDKRFEENRMAIVEENFLDVFSFSLISGKRSEVLKGTNKVVISESIASKYFGTEDPVGKIFQIDDGQIQLQISGVMEDMPSNSHFHFDFLISGETARQIAPESMFTNVGWDSQYIYIKVSKEFDPLAMEASFPTFINEHLDPFTAGNFKLFLQPLLDIHLHSDNGTELESNGNINFIYIFSVIALFILIIACVNYMNLTTARSMKRAREVGMRKVLGAGKLNLIGQFLSESFLMAFIALLFAYCMTWVLLPNFNAFALKEIPRSVLFEPGILLSLLYAFVLIGLVSGIYPAFFLAAFKPLNTIKGNQTTGKYSLGLRRGLVVLQFVISIGLIASTAIVFKQLDFLRNKELGINKESIVAIPLQAMDRSELGAFKSELQSHNSIIKTGVSNMKLPGWIGSSTAYKAQDVE
ncbi:MAG: ABC transporter permease, partial [Bacteroidetes bacterium]|nr:ABC transporter permease [Bacteroidota bacterium]